MSATPTLGDTDQDNSSSINNISSLLAEQGTGTTGTADEEIETSSIEALNWSEADEEELQLQQKIASASRNIKLTTTTAAAAKRQSTPPRKISEPKLKEELQVEKEIDEASGTVLSTSLLQSISSTADSDESTKKTVIENWASDVKEAVERGEMEVGEESNEEIDDDEEEEEDDDGDENMTSKCDDNDSNNENTGMRKRIKLAKELGPMSMSSISTFTVDTSNDPLSNAPVLDDGPIWNKGPKRYRFQENRRINQKLTFGVLLAIVLAIGLGLGNLVAYNECESEYKATQVNSKSSEDVSVTTNTAEPSIKKDDTLPVSNSQTVDEKDKKDIPVIETTSDSNNKLPNSPKPIDQDEKINEKDDSKVNKEEEPKVDPRYALHMETLSKIVKTLDNLQRKIDKFENVTSRQLGGVIMLKDAEEDEEEEQEKEVTPSTDKEETLPSSSLYDEEVHEDLATVSNNDDNDDIEEEEDLFNEEEDVLDLIDGIEETIDYLRRQDEIKFAKKYAEERDLFKSKLFSRNTPASEEEKGFALLVKASMEAFTVAREEFIRQERDQLRENKILGLAEERNPEDYSMEERAEIKRKYEKFISEYPMSQEIDKIKKKLQREERGLKENDDDDIVEEFFDDLNYARNLINDNDEDWNMDGYDDYDEVGNLQKSNDFSSGGAESNKLMDSKSSYHHQSDEHTEIQVEPKKELIETNNYEQSIMDFEPITMGKNLNLPSNNNLDQKDEFPKGDDEEVENKRFKRAKSPKKEYTKNKPERQSKKSREDFEGSGQKPPKKENYEKKYSNNSKKKERKEKQGDNDSKENHNKKDKKFGNGKQTANKEYRNDYDFDDDDDHKRKRYMSNSNKENKDQFPHRNHQKEQDTNWLLERTKAREEIRKDSGNVPEFNQHHSVSGKKAKNWQMERDRVREKFRSKNHKNKSNDN